MIEDLIACYNEDGIQRKENLELDISEGTEYAN